MIHRFVVTNNGESKRWYNVVPDYDKKEFIVNDSIKGKMKVDFEIVEERCEICYFYDAQGDSGGLCRRFPPIPDTDRATYDKPPLVEANGWCGEYKNI